MIDPIQPDYKNTPVSPQRPGFRYDAADHSALSYITIITPFYNTGPVFHETARSVLQQSFQQWEWLIVNDGSTNPEAIAILEAYRHRDPRIRVIDQNPNQGPSAARNVGFQEARSQYIALLDSDNLLEPTAIEKWLWYLQSYPEYAFVKGYSIGFGAQEYLWREGFHNGKVFLHSNQVDSTSLLRKTAPQAAGGYDETIRGGFEDWDFWLRCASHGFWGNTVPEFLDWYRRRPTHSDRWPDWDNGKRESAFRERLRQKYPKLWNGGFPQIQPRWPMPNDTVPDELPCENRLQKKSPRLLMLLPWLTIGGSDKFSLDVLQLLTHHGWEVSIATTLKSNNDWLPQFARYTPDIFVLHHFLRMVDYPRFLRYLIHSRGVEVVLISHSELGYLLLPYLRAHFPEITFIDYNHIYEKYWKNGGYPRLAVEYQEMLDLNIVSSENLRSWMAKSGTDPDRIAVCYTNIDTEAWQPDREQRLAVRHELGLDETIPVILFVGRIHTQKQPRVLAHSLQRLCQQNSRFVTLVAGDGPDLEWLRAFIKNHELHVQVRLLGAVTNQRVKQLMLAADILFLPSQWEGIALTLFEAMACALPIVAADVGGQSELVTPECGVLITPSDEATEAQRYAEVLTELLNNPTHRTEMGQAGRTRVSTHFRLEQMEKCILNLIERARALRTTHPRPRPSLGLGRACAAQAVESFRIAEVAAQLWAERHGSNNRQNVYLAMSHLFEPLYRWGINRGWHWLFPLSEKIRKVLLRQA